MKILVCLSKVPDTTSSIKFIENNTKFDENNSNFIINPYDEWYSLVRAIEIKESTGAEIILITVGDETNESFLKKALSIGGDSAVRIHTDNVNDSYFVAKNISEYAKDKNFDIIFTGKETLNHNGSKVGPMIAQLLEIPMISFASNMELENNKATILRDGLNGKEKVEVNTPFVISTIKGMAEQRIPSMKGIIASRSKQIEIIQALNIEDRTSIVNYEIPDPKKGCKYIDINNIEELVELLKTEAKVL